MPNRKIEAFRKSTFFKTLPEDNLKELGSIATIREFEAGETIFSDGTYGEGFYLVCKGHIMLYNTVDESEEKVQEAFDGDIFGEVILFAGVSYPARARAVTTSECLLIKREDFKQLISGNPQIAMNIIAILSNRVRYVES